MWAENKRNAKLTVGIRFALLVLGRGIQALVKELAIVGCPFLMVSLVLLGWSCFNHMKGEGHAQWPGPLGFTFIGLILMVRFPDTYKNAGSEKKGIGNRQASPESPPHTQRENGPSAESGEEPPPSQRHTGEENYHYYQLLGLEHGATEEDVIRAYGDLIAVWNPDLSSQDLALQQKARERLKAINEASDKLLIYLASSPRERSQVRKEQSTTQDYGGFMSARRPTGQPLGPPHRPEPASIPSVKSKARSPLLGEISNGVVVLVVLSVLVATAIIGWYIYTSIPSSPSGQANPTAARNNTSNSFLANAVAHFRQDELDKAVEDYTSAISFDPKSARAYAGRGDAYYRKGLYGLAIGDYDRAVEISRDPIYMRMRALACYSRGTELYRGSEGRMGEEFFLRAKSDLDGVLSAKSDDAEAYYYRGVATCLVGRVEEGLPDIKTAARLGYKPAQKYLAERGYSW